MATLMSEEDRFYQMFVLRHLPFKYVSTRCDGPIVIEMEGLRFSISHLSFTYLLFERSRHSQSSISDKCPQLLLDF